MKRVKTIIAAAIICCAPSAMSEGSVIVPAHPLQAAAPHRDQPCLGFVSTDGASDSFRICSYPE